MLAAVEWSQGIQDAWSRVTVFVPKFVGFLIILLIGWFIAKAIAKAADRILERLGFDRAIERGGIAPAMANTKYDPSDVVSKVIYYALMLIGTRGGPASRCGRFVVSTRPKEYPKNESR